MRAAKTLRDVRARFSPLRALWRVWKECHGVLADTTQYTRTQPWPALGMAM
jgi:hypothetical protein